MKELFSSRGSTRIVRPISIVKSFGGFTLIELLISIAIIGILTGIVISAFFRFRDASLLNTTADNLTSLFEEAHNATLASRNDSVYGVHITATSSTLFQGSTYVAGASTNKVVVFDSRITASTTISGGNVLFARQTGATSNTGTTTISLVSSSTTKRTIYIGAGGTIER